MHECVQANWACFESLNAILTAPMFVCNENTMCAAHHVVQFTMWRSLPSEKKGATK
jgi:hypothetical protein